MFAACPLWAIVDIGVFCSFRSFVFVVDVVEFVYLC